mmetsp:Transcript_6883/g.14924  ORF Transcript_6883/g.14924 Transcript_6883/m.14924 type:complete len:224 (-) Transcript_6883:417-1088(-)
MSTQHVGQMTTAAWPVVLPLSARRRSCGSSMVRLALQSAQFTKMCSGVRPASSSRDMKRTRRSMAPSTFIPANIEKNGVPAFERARMPEVSACPSCAQLMSAKGLVSASSSGGSSAMMERTSGTKCFNALRMVSCRVTALCGQPRQAPRNISVTWPVAASKRTSSTSPPSACTEGRTRAASTSVISASMLPASMFPAFSEPEPGRVPLSLEVELEVPSSLTTS